MVTYNKKLTSFLLVFVLILSFVPSTFVFAQEAGTNAQNPVIQADIPDLSFIRVGDSYYMTSTTMHMNPGVPIMKSKDLINWEIVNYVYDILGTDDVQALRNGKEEYGRGSWASSLNYRDGKFYVVFASYSTGKTHIFQTTDIENGPWEQYKLDGVYHDMSLFFEDDRAYLIYGGGDIKLIELNAEATAIKPGAVSKTIIANSSSVAGGTSGTLSEGAHVYKIDGKYYVFLITWPSGKSRTQICYRADSLDGIYEGKVLLQQSVAQGGIVQTPSGDWFTLLFRDNGPVGRIPFLLPVTWVDGWPEIQQDITDTGISVPKANLKVVASDEFNQSSKKIGAYHTVIEDTSVSTPVTPPVAPQPLPVEEGRELLVNGGFENGLTPWASHEGATIAVTTEGVYNILAITNRGATGAGPQQSLVGKVKAGGVYHFSAKVKYDDPAAPASRRFQMNYQDGNWQTIKVMGGSVITKGEWGTVQGTYTVPADALLNNPLVFIETSWTAAQDLINDRMDFYVDDVKFVDISPDPNILRNGGFDHGVSPWSEHEEATISVIQEGSNNILAITNRPATGSGPQQYLTGKVKAGGTYKFSAKVKYDAESAPATRNFIMSFQDGNWQTIKNMGSRTLTKGQWGTIEGTYTIPADLVLNEPRIFIETSWTQAQHLTNDRMDFYVDDISLIDVTPVNVDTIKNGENDYNGSNLGLVWQWNHNPNNNLWSLTQRPGYLRLTTGSKSTSLLDARNTLTQRTFGPQSSANVAIDISTMKDGDYAGLSALQFHYGFVGVKMTGTSKSIVMVKGSSNNPNNASTPVEVTSVPVTQNRVYFKVECDYLNNSNKGYFYYSLDGITWIAIGEPITMVYTMPHFMGYRFGLFNYATKSTGGYVDFDYYRIDDKITGAGTVSALNANLEDVSNILGVQNIQFEIPVKMDELSAGDYKSIEASFTIPEPFTVDGVVFNTDNITGTSTYTYANNQLKLKVTGDSVSFVNQASNKLFATIKLKVMEFVPEDKTISITTDYIKVDGGSLVYNVHNAVAKVGLKKLNTNAYAKVPGYGNPLISHKLSADPCAMVYKDRVYIYTSSDDYEYDSQGKIKENTYANLNRVRVISSDDMANWTDHGDIPVGGANGANGGKGIAKWAALSWAPTATYKNIDGKDKFFLYFSNNASGVGVLTSDSPIGPWVDPIGKALISREVSPQAVDGVTWIFDPAVLVDDDGTGYLYYGGGIPGGNNPTDAQSANPKTARVIKLGDDMTSLVGDAKMIDAPYMFENAGIHKYNNKYYYSYCTNFRPRTQGAPPAGEIAYMVSDNPMGPFTYQANILKNPNVFFGVGGNNHHSMFEFKNQWYITYHAQTVSKAIMGTGMGYRSTHINKFSYFDNGKIKDITADMKGVPQIKKLNPYQRTEAETIGWNAGILTQECNAPGYPVASTNLNVTDIHNGDWIAVSNADFGSKGAGKFAANVAATVGGKIEIRLDSPQGNLIGTLDVDSTGGEQAWQLMECDVENVKGVHSIFFVFTGEGGNNLFNMDYWKFTEAEPAPTVIPLESISITGAVSSLEVNEEFTIGSQMGPSDATDPSYQWTASGAITTVGDTNKNEVTIKGVSAGTGTLTLTVSAGGVEKSTVAEITVTSPDIVDPEPGVVPVQSVEIVGGTATVDMNDTLSFGSRINPTNATSPTYQWTASEAINIVGDSTKNTVTIKGVSVGTGKLTLTVVAGETEKKDEINIKVTNEGFVSVTGVTLNKSQISLIVGNSEVLTAVINPQSATNKNVIWKTSDVNIAQVDNTGKVTAVAAGTVTIRVVTEDGNMSASCDVTVSSSSGGGGGGGSIPTPQPNTPVVPPTAPVDTPPVNQIPSVLKVELSIANGTAFIEGKKIELSVKPYIQNGRTVVGVRDMANLLQIDSKNIIWNAKTKTVVIKSNGKNIELVIDQKYAIVDGKKVDLDVAPQIKDGRTVLPVALVARLMGIKVQFDAATKDVTFSIAK